MLRTLCWCKKKKKNIFHTLENILYILICLPPSEPKSMLSWTIKTSCCFTALSLRPRSLMRKNKQVHISTTIIDVGQIKYTNKDGGQTFISTNVRSPCCRGQDTKHHQTHWKGSVNLESQQQMNTKMFLFFFTCAIFLMQWHSWQDFCIRIRH